MNYLGIYGDRLDSGLRPLVTRMPWALNNNVNTRTSRRREHRCANAGVFGWTSYTHRGIGLKCDVYRIISS
jgi:hypothetical protein